MSSGKSLQLLAMAHNFESNDIPYIILKPNVDTRDGVNIIHSRAMSEDKECVGVDNKTNIYRLIDETITVSNTLLMDRLKWVLVDEARFLTPKQVDELSGVADKLGVNVMCYGLRTDFQTNLFPGSKRLFEICDGVEEIKCSCKCGDKAIFNARIDGEGNIIIDGEQIELGGNDKYMAICRKCYNERTNKNFYTITEE